MTYQRDAVVQQVWKMRLKQLKRCSWWCWMEKSLTKPCWQNHWHDWQRLTFCYCRCCCSCLCSWFHHGKDGLYFVWYSVDRVVLFDSLDSIRGDKSRKKCFTIITGHMWSSTINTGWSHAAKLDKVCRCCSTYIPWVTFLLLGPVLFFFWLPLLLLLLLLAAASLLDSLVSLVVLSTTFKVEFVILHQ